MLVRVVFANQSGFDAPIGVDLAWEERASCLNIFWMTNRGRISEIFTNFEAKHLLRNRLGMGGAWIMSQHIPDDKSQSDLKKLHELRGKTLVAQERGSCLNIFRMTNRDRISETFKNYEAKDLLRNESKTSVRVVFVKRSGLDSPIRVVLEWEEHGSCINISQMTNRGRISETYKNYEAKDLLRSESNTSVRVVLANWSSFDAPIGVVLAWEERGSCLNIIRMTNHVLLEWEERGSCLNIFQTRNHGWISETFTNYEAKDFVRKILHELRGKRLVAQVGQTRRFALYLRTRVVLILQFESSWYGRSVDHVLPYSGRQIVFRSQKPSRITRPKTCCACGSNTSVRVVFANPSGFDSPIRVVMELRGKTLDALMSQTRQLALYLRTGVVLILQLESCWPGRSADHDLTYSGRQIAVRSQKPSRITRQKTCCARAWVISQYVPEDKSRSDLRNLHELGGKRLVAQSTWHGRSVDHVLTYFGRKIAVKSQKPSRIMRQKTCCASESNTSARVVFANRSGFDAPIGVFLHGTSVDHVLTYFRRQIAVESQKPSRITRQKTYCASESNTSVRVVFANQSGFDAPIAVDMAWEERG
ncbi:uncharacterized protein G2W53_014416 [Senna tora]|uniref:Uncharacterized protein n=1 Tax=Senna tora TaxID=362788 RepID=A0A834WTG6_9FABA|nr:uncharacterized protein G2W53_014416 [Senna tora]